MPIVCCLLVYPWYTLVIFPPVEAMVFRSPSTYSPRGSSFHLAHVASASFNETPQTLRTFHLYLPRPCARSCFQAFRPSTWPRLLKDSPPRPLYLLINLIFSIRARADGAGRPHRHRRLHPPEVTGFSCSWAYRAAESLLFPRFWKI